MYVVAGVTGHTGAVVANTLLAEGKPVRVIVRSADKGKAFADRGAEVAVASLDDIPALTKAFTGASAAYLLVPPNPTSNDVIAHGKKIIDAIATAIKATKLPHVVWLSSIGAQHADGTGPIKMHHYAEATLGAITKLTALRPGYFFTNLLNLLPAIKGQGVLPVFTDPNHSFPMIDVADIGKAAAAVLVEPPPASSIIELAGPAERSPADAAAAFAKALGKPVQAFRVPDAGAVAAFVAAGMSEDMAKLYAEMNQAVGKGLFAFEGHKLVRGTTTLETFVAKAVQ